MRLDEFTLAGEQPSPILTVAQQRAQQAPSPANGDSFGDHIVSLINKQKSMDPNDPKSQFIDKLIGMISSIPEEGELDEGILDRVKGGFQSVKRKVSTTNRALIKRANETFYNAILERVRKLDPNVAAEFERLAKQADTELGPVENDKDVKKANQAAITGIQLNTKGEIGALDADIEKTAQEFAERFDLELKWARNLIGMFSIKIDREDRKRFLDACYAGTALDTDKMVAMGEGPVDAVVTTTIPKVKEVFDSVKATLLDISLSTGQRGATGPFEAMLAIMGGAVKPSGDEGGDVKLKDGRKFEVKGSSLSPSSSFNTKGELPATGSISGGWIDSMAMKEIGGTAFRQIADNWLAQSKIPVTKEFKESWKNMNFLAKALPNMVEVMRYLSATRRGSPNKLIETLMSTVFPNAAKSPDFDFVASCKRIVVAIAQQDVKTIAHEQGVMALLEYILGKGNDGFILFNSSTQTFKIIEGVAGVLEVANNPGGVSFPTPMTMGKKDRCSPAIYWGPDPKSTEAKEYFKMYNSDPKRVKLRRAALAQKNKKV